MESKYRAVGKLEYLMRCERCGKPIYHHGNIEEYHYQYYHYGRHFFCGWNCYIPGLVDATLKKKRLSADDVQFLQRYNRKVPWDKVSVRIKEELGIIEY